jgi:ATP-binding cassette subfamily F protein 3
LPTLEGELARVSDELRELDARLADPDFYHAGHADEVAVTLKRRGELAGRVDELEAQWIAVTTQLEAIA